MTRTITIDPKTMKISVATAIAIAAFALSATWKAWACLHGISADVAGIRRDVAMIRAHSWTIEDMAEWEHRSERNNIALPLHVPSARQIVRDRLPD